MITPLASERVGTWSQAAAPRAGVVITPLYCSATPSHTWLPGLFSHPGWHSYFTCCQGNRDPINWEATEGEGTWPLAVALYMAFGDMLAGTGQEDVDGCEVIILKEIIRTWNLKSEAFSLYIDMYLIDPIPYWVNNYATLIYFLILHCRYIFLYHLSTFVRDFPGGSDGKASAYNAGDVGSIPGSGRSLGEGNGNPLQYSCLENPMDGGAW